MDNLYLNIVACNFQKFFESKGYAFFTKGDYNLNIIGVRRDTLNKVTNKFDDFLVVIYKNGHGEQKLIYNITTDPGKNTMLRPISSKGTAILVPGQYRGVYKLDKHNGKYKALCQRLGVVKVYRDNNKDLIYDLKPETTESGSFGINIHRSHATVTAVDINGYSAGCQVFANPKDFASFIRLCETSSKLYGNKFTYTLVTEQELNKYLKNELGKN